VILILSKLLVADEDIQEVQNQIELDTNVMSLAEIINDTFDIVEKADELRRESKSKIIMRMIQQTTECAWFVRDYMKIENFCKLYKLI
jgi:DNA-binding ferritin-like protein